MKVSDCKCQKIFFACAWPVCCTDHVIFSREFFFFPSKNYLFVYTWLFENLKARILNSSITRGNKPPSRNSASKVDKSNVINRYDVAWYRKSVLHENVRQVFTSFPGFLFSASLGRWREAETIERGWQVFSVFWRQPWNKSQPALNSVPRLFFPHLFKFLWRC